MPNLGPRALTATKPSVDVQLDRHYSSKVYTSGSEITGRVIITCARDVPFDTFDVIFTGVAYTRLDFVQQFPTHSARTFLKLRMPLAPSDLPESHIFKAETRYAIPFNFIVPHQLTLGACNHQCENAAVREQHLKMPPSLGGWEADDQAPEMARVEYAITARATKKQTATPSNTKVKLFEQSKKLKLLPARSEEPPLDITVRDERYVLSKTKEIRKSVFSGKSGRLTASATQPGAAMLSGDAHSMSSTRTQVRFEFASSRPGATPPKINSVSAKLQAITFFSARAANHLPNLGPRNKQNSNPSLTYSTSVSLFNSPVEKMTWAQHDIASERRDSGYSSVGAEEAPGSGNETEGPIYPHRQGKSKKIKSCPVRHTATLDVPISIPTGNKNIFVPSFHSCVVSRTYTLQLHISTGSNTTISLFLPLQIGVETLHQPQEGELPSFESAVAQAEQEEADAYWQPRTALSRALPTSVQRAILPGYAELTGHTIQVG